MTAGTINAVINQRSSGVNFVIPLFTTPSIHPCLVQGLADALTETSVVDGVLMMTYVISRLSAIGEHALELTGQCGCVRLVQTCTHITLSYELIGAENVGSTFNGFSVGYAHLG